MMKPTKSGNLSVAPCESNCVKAQVFPAKQTTYLTTHPAVPRTWTTEQHISITAIMLFVRWSSGTFSLKFQLFSVLRSPNPASFETEC